ncbi:hypothetical protein AAK967_04110 [Atopobiaceae bacterium 24-176]
MAPQETGWGAAAGKVDLDGLLAALEKDPFPIESLKSTVSSVRIAQARRVCGGVPDALSSFFAEQLDDAGIFTLADDTCARLVPCARSGQVRLDVSGPGLEAEALDTLRRVESALNRAVYAKRCLGVRTETSVTELYLLSDSIERSVACEASGLDLASQGHGDRDEWEVRRAIALGLQSLRLPYRLECRFRLNLSAGVTALAFDATDPRLIAPREWSQAQGTRRTTPKRRQLRAMRLTCRVSMVLAAMALSASPRLREAWVQATDEDGRCLLSWRATRESLGRLDLEGPGDRPEDELVAQGASIDACGEGLRPTAPLFSMGDPLLCPSWRSDEPEASERALPLEAGQALGASAMADLAIRGTARRRQAARLACARLNGSCAHDVAAILQATTHDADREVRAAGQRVVEALIEGTLDSADTEEVLDALMADGELGRAVREAFDLLASHEGRDSVRVQGCAEKLRRLLSHEEEAEPYRNEDGLVWRFFNSYAERALYNRLSHDGSEVRLVPAPYYHAHGALASLSMRLGRADQALAYALRAVELDPMDVNARLRAARCYELLGDAPMAEATVIELLELAHDPDSICAAYLRLGGALRQSGDLRMADASLRHALSIGGICAPAAATALADLVAHGGYEQIPAACVCDELETAGIPLAPVAKVGEVLVDGAKAAVNGGVFPVARDLTTLVGLLTHDESLLAMASSMEPGA